MDFDSYYSAVNFYGDEINLKSGIVRYGSNGLATININSTDLNYIVLRDCGVALSINEGNLDANYLVLFNCNNSGLIYVSDNVNNFNILISKCIVIGIKERGISIEKAHYYNISHCLLSNNNVYAIENKDCDGTIENCEFSTNYYDIYYDKSCLRNDILNNNFFNSILCIRLRGYINNINYNNFYGPSIYFIYIIYGIPPYSLVFSDVNATNNYWSVNNIDRYLADGNDDINCPYYILYIPILNNPNISAGIK